MPRRITELRDMVIAAVVSTILITLLNFAFIDQGIMAYKQDALGSTNFNKLPLLVPFLIFMLVISGLFLYEYLNRVFRSSVFEKYTLAISNMLLGLCIAFGFFTHARIYTLTTFVILFLLLIAIEYVNKIRFMLRFYRLFLAFLIPFWLINFILITQGIYSFDPEKRIRLDIGQVPVENFFVGMIMLLIAVFIYERLQHPKRNAKLA